MEEMKSGACISCIKDGRENYFKGPGSQTRVMDFPFLPGPDLVPKTEVPTFGHHHRSLTDTLTRSGLEDIILKNGLPSDPRICGSIITCAKIWAQSSVFSWSESHIIRKQIHLDLIRGHKAGKVSYCIHILSHLHSCSSDTRKMEALSLYLNLIRTYHEIGTACPSRRMH